MTMESDAEAFIRQWENEELTVYIDIGGKPTVGVGHLVLPEDNLNIGDTISQQESDDFFAEDFDRALVALEELVKVDLSDPQRIALISFIFNIGAENFKTSTLLEKLNASDYAGAADQFTRWDHVNHVVSKGLLNRRLAEKKLFVSTLNQS